MTKKKWSKRNDEKEIDSNEKNWNWAWPLYHTPIYHTMIRSGIC